MRIRELLLRGVVVAGVLLVAGCSSETEVATPSAVSSTTPPVSAAPAVTTCVATPEGDFGLTDVQVSSASVIWRTNRAAPDFGTIVFTVRDQSVIRGLKLTDGKVVANYLFDMASASQENISRKPTIVGTAFLAAMPAGYTPAGYTFGDTWTADLEVDGQSTGQCSH